MRSKDSAVYKAHSYGKSEVFHAAFNGSAWDDSIVVQGSHFCVQV